jgi:hypothetical protein
MKNNTFIKKIITLSLLGMLIYVPIISGNSNTEKAKVSGYLEIDANDQLTCREYGYLGKKIPLNRTNIEELSLERGQWLSQPEEQRLGELIDSKLFDLHRPTESSLETALNHPNLLQLSIRRKQSSLFTNINNFDHQQSIQNFINNKLGIQNFATRQRHSIRRIIYRFDNMPTNAGHLLSDFVQQERIEQAKGRYTLAYANNKHMTSHADIFKKLLEVISGSPIGNYHCLRFRKQDMEAESQEKAILRNGRTKRRNGCTQRHYSLVMNHALFGNIDDWAFSSFCHFLLNVNTGLDPAAIYQIFDQFNMQDYYQRYSTRLDQLNKAFVSDYGSILLLSFSPEQINKSVYPTHPNLSKQGVNINGVGTSTNMQTILDALRNDASNIANEGILKYCCILTNGPTGTLNPWNPGIRIYTYCPARTKAYLQLLDDIFDDIKADLLADPVAMAAAQKALLDIYPYAPIV